MIFRNVCIGWKYIYECDIRYRLRRSVGGYYDRGSNILVFWFLFWVAFLYGLLNYLNKLILKSRFWMNNNRSVWN